MKFVVDAYGADKGEEVLLGAVLTLLTNAPI